ncbi:hypothetical protein D7Z54_19350 [Salibacterium salarium]|uniref:Lipoprotein n=1 Tax=Salibacterium salarium TaxID=284579 RepID=A0A428N063_9BACI|nr:hypothetical protein D7Z54_19350 [Salibacterium salarium]
MGALKVKKILIPMMILFTTSLLLVACSNDDNQNGSSDKTNSSENTSASQPEKNDDAEESSQTDKKENKSESTSESEDPETDDSNETFSKENKDSKNQSNSKENKGLSEYSSNEIEYARVWLELGPNQDIDELYVRHISAGEPLHPDDETSANYPEDVVQLSGPRLVDGSVTYSSNGDGTINVYNVPLRWDGKNPAGEDFYKDIIENTKTASIDPGDDQKVIKLIKLLNIDHYAIRRDFLQTFYKRTL